MLDMPVRKTTPPGVWSAHEYEKLAEFDQPDCIKFFECHHSALGSAEAVCRGWIGMYPDSIGARLLVSFGSITDEQRWIPMPADVELYESGIAARDAGLAAVDEPPYEACLAVDRLEQKRRRARER